MGTNFAPMANAIGGPNIKPLASIPAESHGYQIKKIIVSSTENKSKIREWLIQYLTA